MAQIRNSLKNCSKAKLDYDRNWNTHCFQEINDALRVHVSVTHCDNGSNGNNRLINQHKAKHQPDDDNETCELNSSDETVEDKLFLQNDTELQRYDYLVNNTIKQKLDSYYENVNTFSKELCDEKEEELKIIRQKYLLQALKKIKHYNEEFESFVDEVKKEKAEAARRAEEVKCKLKQIEDKYKKSAEEDRQNAERKIVEERCSLVTKIKLEAESIVKEIEMLAEKNGNLINELKLNHSVKQQQNALLMNLNNIEMCLTKKVISEEDVRNAENLKLGIEKTKKLFEKQLNELQLQRKLELENEKQQRHACEKEVNKAELTPLRSETSYYIDDKALKSYENSQLFFNDFENRLQSFVADDSWKNYRTLLQLFIRTNVNAISSHSMDHLRDRIKKLTFLFSGKEIEFQGKKLACNQHCEAANFCMYWAAKTFISVSTKQVTPKSVFSFAVVITVLWSRFPHFGQLFLAFLQQKCPYVVPYYPQREADDSETNYLIACGYDYSADGKSLESEESFLNRMRALIRLYGAIMQTNKLGFHPHGINFAWIFIARLLNLEPRPGITAATIHAFMSTAAYRLFAIYRQQFLKLLSFIKNDYISRIERCSSKDVKKQAVSQLKTLLEEFEKHISVRSTLKKPEGLEKLEIIPDNF